MILYPAIDIMDGHAVRLVQGRFEDATTYNDSPAAAERAIVGTQAFRDVDFLDEVLSAFGPRIVVSVDARGGHVATAGWTQTTELPAEEAIHRLGDRGVRS